MTKKSVLKKNDIVTLNIEDVTLEGSGVAKHDGFAVFVPNAAVGDLVEVVIIKTTSSYAVAKILNIINASKDRVDLDCGVAKRCGGCAFRHISYSAELKIKQRHVESCIKRIGGFDNVKVNEIKGAKDILSYRNKAQMPVGYNSQGEIVTGFYGLHSHNIVECNRCFLQPKLFDDIAVEIKQWMKKYNVPAYNETLHKGLVRHIYLRCSSDERNVMLCLVINGCDLPFKNELIKLITGKFTNVTSIILNINTNRTNVVLGDKFVSVYGENYLTDTLCGLKFQISPDSFYQVNHDQTELLYNTAKSMLNLSPADNIVDLYCGIGTIGLTMADNIKKLTGVEIVESAVKNAWTNAKNNGITNAEFFCGDSKSARCFKNSNLSSRPNIIIVDPPRKGCSDEVIDDLIALAPEKILYISCNAATLAKNLKKLCEEKYTISQVQPIDLFPRTSHVEVCCCLSLK